MGHSTAERPGSNDYVVLDLPENSCSVLLNLDLVDALRRFGKRERQGIHGILLGRAVQSGSNRTLLTIEDCQAVQDPQRISEDLAYWRTEELDRMNAVGLLSDGSNDDRASFDRHFAGSAAVFLMMVPVRGAVPLGRVFDSGSGPHERDAPYSEIPLDSSKLKSGGFTILRGTRSPERRPAPAALSRLRRRWAWAPLAAALLALGLVITAVTFWAVDGPADSAPEQLAAPPARVSEPESAPIALPPPVPLKSKETQPQKRSSPVSPAPPPRVDRRRRPVPSTVSFEFSGAAPSGVRGILNRVPGLPLFRRRHSKDGDDFVPPSPARQSKPDVPVETAREFPGEWRVDLRLAIDKSGQITQASLLSANSNREFVKLAREAIDNWEFNPARWNQRPVSSTVDITFRFRNPVAEPGDRAGR